MDKKATTFALIVTGTLIAVIIATGQALPKGTRLEWKMSSSDNPGMVHFTIERSKPGHRWMTSTDVRFANFRGISRESIDRGGPAKFEYVHDAGSLICEGSFHWYRGSGTYQFQPDPKFVTELRSLGYSTPSEEQIFYMLLSDVSLDFARGVSEAGLHASTDQLIELRNHGVSLNFIQDTSRAGYRDLLADDYIQLRDHGVSSNFLRDLKSNGYNFPASRVVELRDHGVPSEFLADLKAAGYNLPADRIVELRDHGVNSNDLRELKDYGLQPGAEELVELKNHGVSTRYLKSLKGAGYGSLQAGEITNLHDHGVPPEFVQESKDLGYSFTPQELIGLRDHGVDSGYLRRLRDTGLRNLNAEQITKLHDHGVD